MNFELNHVLIPRPARKTKTMRVHGLFFSLTSIVNSDLKKTLSFITSKHQITSKIAGKFNHML